MAILTNKNQKSIPKKEYKVSRNFKGVWIDRSIWLNPKLSIIEKAFLAEIDSLSKQDRGCFASNSYFAWFFDLSERQVSRTINSLVKKGMLDLKQKRRGVKTVERILTPKILLDKNVVKSESSRQKRREVVDKSVSKVLDKSVYQSNIELIIKSNNKDTPGKKPDSKKTTIYQSFINNWSLLYENETNYSFKADKKDFVIATALIKKFGAPEVLKKAKILFKLCKTKEIWFTKNGMGDFTLNKLSNKWNEILESKSHAQTVFEAVTKGSK